VRVHLSAAVIGSKPSALFDVACRKSSCRRELDMADWLKDHGRMPQVSKRISKPARRAPSAATASELLLRVRDVGRDVEAVVRRAGLAHSAAGLLEPDWNGALTRDEFARLYAECTWALDEHASAQEGRAPLTKPEFDMLCYCVITCVTLRAAIDRTATFSAMLMPRTAKLELIVEGDVAELRMATVRKHRNVSAFVSDLTGLSSHHRLFGWLIGEDLPLLEVAVRYPALLSDETASRLMPHPLTYRAAENALRFPARYLDRPVVRTPAELERLLERFPFDPEEPQSKLTSLSEQVRLVIGAALAQGAGLPTGARLAAQFSISRATLTRRLQEEGTSLGQLKDASRCELAEHLLRRGGLPVAEVAALAGYSDSTTFSRAFKAWTGATPGRWLKASITAAGATAGTPPPGSPC
jgi:AraC-like DNA-binding protein